MKRFTERDEFGNANIIGVDSADLQLNLDFGEMNRVTEALNRFAAYEETGRTPEEIAELDHDVAMLKQSARLVNELSMKLTALKAENERLRAERDADNMQRPIELSGEAAQSFTLALELSEANITIRRLEAERDAAIKDLDDIQACSVCKNAWCNGGSCISFDGCSEGLGAKWEWRGLEGQVCG